MNEWQESQRKLATYPTTDPKLAPDFFCVVYMINIELNQTDIPRKFALKNELIKFICSENYQIDTFIEYFIFRFFDQNDKK